MKRIVLLSVFSVSIFSCSKNAEQIEIVKKDVERNLSEIEKKDVSYNCIELSDRDAYKEIMRFDLMKKEKAEIDYENILTELKLDKYRAIPLTDMSDAELINYQRNLDFSKSFLASVETSQKKYSDDLKEFAKLQGKNIYYRVEVVKANADTIIHRKVFLDNNNKIIYRKAFK